MANITVIVGHAQRGTFCEALGEAYRRGAESGGHRARLFVLSRLRFDPILHEGYANEQSLEPDLRAAYAAMKGSEHVVIIFPLWCGTLPAILKGFIERVLQPDLIAIQKSGRSPGLNLGIFQNTSARVIVTMGMPAFIYRWWFGAYAVKMLRRNILQFVGIKPVHSTVFGEIAAASDGQREAMLRKVEDLGRAAR